MYIEIYRRSRDHCRFKFLGGYRNSRNWIRIRLKDQDDVKNIWDYKVIILGLFRGIILCIDDCLKCSRLRGPGRFNIGEFSPPPYNL